MKRIALGLALAALALALGVAVFGIPETGTSERTRELVAAMAESYGGAEALEGISAVRMEGRLEAANGRRGRLVRVSRGVGELASLTEYEAASELRILAQGQGWTGHEHDALEPAEPVLAAAMHLQSARLLAPFLLARNTHQLILIAEDDTSAVLSLPLGGGASLEARINLDSHHVVQTRTRAFVAGNDLDFTTRYSDFRPVGDLRLPHREENTAQGIATAVIEMDSYVIDPSGEGLLLIPAGRIAAASSHSP